jgi:hypothetical protein
VTEHQAVITEPQQKIRQHFLCKEVNAHQKPLTALGIL